MPERGGVGIAGAHACVCARRGGWSVLVAFESESSFLSITNQWGKC